MHGKELNFKLINQQYRRKKSVKNGLIKLSGLINEDNVLGLRSLLRDHTQAPIEELDLVRERNNIDLTLEYYSVLALGFLSGYFPNELPEHLAQEIEGILGHVEVRPYYELHYPLVLPQWLLEQVRKKGDLLRYTDVAAGKCYERFLGLEQILNKDLDVAMFRWFLDDGQFRGYSLAQIWLALQGQGGELDWEEDSPLTQGLRGMLKYLQLLQDYAQLLKDTKAYPLLQTGFWQFQAYWFDQLKDKLGNMVEKALGLLQGMVQRSTAEELQANERSFVEEEGDLELLQGQGDLDELREDLAYLLNFKAIPLS